MSSDLHILKERLGEVTDLDRAEAVLGWDQQTMMPANAAPVRAEQIATLARLRHQLFTSNETGRLLASLEGFAESLPAGDDDAALIRVTRRDWEKARLVPDDLATEMARAASAGMYAWVDARATNDFAAFASTLQHHLDLKQRYIACFPDISEPYDALLDDYESGMPTSTLRRLFAELKEGLRPVIEVIARNPEAVDATPLHGSFDTEIQERLCRALIRPWGFDEAGWRLDTTFHPFETSFATQDVRLTTRYDEAYLGTALFGTLHECGHGLYEAGVSPALERTPLCHGCSSGLHESQSRMWENLVGRGRPYWDFALPYLQEAFPDQFGRLDADQVYRATNRMEPSLIRVEADEATYSMHVIIRFELEIELFEGRLKIADLPEAWNAKYREYLGIEVPDDASGVLQDVHWSEGLFGCFPGYAVGNLIASQMWEEIVVDLPRLDDQIRAGEFSELRAWLTNRLYRHGRKFSAPDTIRLATGGELSTVPYLGYITSKVNALYGAGSAATLTRDCCEKEPGR